MQTFAAGKHEIVGGEHRQHSLGVTDSSVCMNEGTSAICSCCHWVDNTPKVIRHRHTVSYKDTSLHCYDKQCNTFTTAVT
jgi:hypothetical protein